MPNSPPPPSPFWLTYDPVDPARWLVIQREDNSVRFTGTEEECRSVFNALTQKHFKQHFVGTRGAALLPYAAVTK